MLHRTAPTLTAPVLALAALLPALAIAAPAWAQQAQPQPQQAVQQRTADPESYPGRQPGPGQPVPGEAGTPPEGRGTPGTPGEAITDKENLAGRSTMTREAGGGAPSDQATERGLRDEDIRATQHGQPTQQGPRPPEIQKTEASDRLYQVLAAVRHAPPGLDGNPIPRPNMWASEPDMVEDPSRSANPSEQTSREVQ